MDLVAMLSEILHDYSDVRISHLTGIERTRLNRIKNGKLKIEFHELQKIIKVFTIDDDTAKKLYDAFIYQKLGRDRYNANRLAKDFLTSMKFEKGDEETLNGDTVKTDINVSFDFPGEIKTLSGRFSVKYITAMVMSRAATNNEKIRIVSSPFNLQILAMVLTLTASCKDLDVKQLFSISVANELADPQTYYMQVAKAVYPIFMLNSNYSAYYSMTGHVTNAIMPFNIITEQYCLMISADNSSAILLKDKSVIELYSKIFDQRIAKCSPFIKKIRTGGDYLVHYANIMEATSSAPLSKTLYSIDFEPCMLHLVNEGDVQNMIESAKGDPTTLETLERIQTELLARFNSIPQVGFFTKKGVESFIKTGRIAEIPDSLGLQFSYERRREMLSSILETARINDPKDKMYFLLNEKEFDPPLGLRFLGSGLSTDHLFIMSNSHDGMRSILMFSNPEVTSAVFQFVESLSESNMVYTHEEMIAYLEKTIGAMSE